MSDSYRLDFVMCLANNLISFSSLVLFLDSFLIVELPLTPECDYTCIKSPGLTVLSHNRYLLNTMGFEIFWSSLHSGRVVEKRSVKIETSMVIGTVSRLILTWS